MLLAHLVLDGSVEHVPVFSPVSDQPSVNPYFLRSQRDTGFSCPGCRGEISYAELMYMDRPEKVRADMFGFVTGDSLCVSCPHCGRTVHYMLQRPPAVLAMCLDSGPCLRPAVRSFSRRLRGFFLSFFIRAFSPAAERF